jgi:hypothetical protein
MFLKRPLLKVKSIASKMDLKYRFLCSYVSVYIATFEYLIMDFLKYHSEVFSNTV